MSPTTQTPNRPPRPAAPVPPDTALVAIGAAFDREANAIANLLSREGDVARYRELFLDVVSKDEKLLRCTEVSLIRSIRDMAKLDLEPVLGEAYLVPFWNTRKSTYEATLIIGYEGLKTLAFRSGFVTLIEGDVVRERDEFVYVRGYPETIVRHVPATGERGDITGAWSMVHLREAPRPLISYLPIDRIEQRRRVSRSGTGDNGEVIGIWRDWYEEQAAKTSLRFALKLAPKSVRARVADALAIEDAVDSLLSLEGAEPKLVGAGSGKTKRKRRMMARLTGSVDPDASDVEEGETRELPEGSEAAGSTETGGEAEVAHESAPEPSEATTPDAPPGAAKSGGTVLCGVANPYGGAPCGVAAGHETGSGAKLHKELDEHGKVVATWPIES